MCNTPFVIWNDLDDARLRREAIAWLTVRSNDGTTPMTTSDILDFTFDGSQFRLMDAQRGIRKPAVLPHALSLRTIFTPEGQVPPYADSAELGGLIQYKWRGDDGAHSENRSIRDAMIARVPLIWFVGVHTALYLPVFPVFVVEEQLHLKQFELQIDDSAQSIGSSESAIENELRKRYLTYQARRRLHQPIFRSKVIRAYTSRCSVCSLAHPKLLDAAHIMADHVDESTAAISNGLALCKIHHAAYDSDILGISPDLTVGIREDILAEVDGPMLKHGLQELHGSKLRVVPNVRRERPDPSLLEQRWTKFQAG